MSIKDASFDDVLLKPGLGILDSRKDADISAPSLGLTIPLIAAPMPSVSSTSLISEMARLGGMGIVHRMNRTDLEIIADFHNSGVMPPVAIGLETDVSSLIYHGVNFLVLDVAHAHSLKALHKIDTIKDQYGSSVHIMAGSVATRDGAADVVEAGADSVRVGIGPGSVCTTRSVTGFGVPQLWAISECKEGTYDGNGGSYLPIIADGGIRNSGDIVKALAAGADAVMIGGLFARSLEANSIFHYGNASKRVNGHRAPEGMSVEIASDEREPLEDIVKRLTWGIRSGISYGGVTSIKELQEDHEWIRLTDAGRKESKL